jgi:hypothetical protein
VASKKKKSNVQKMAALATAGLPAPVQKVASTKIGSMLLIVGAVIAVATGAITISSRGACRA